MAVIKEPGMAAANVLTNGTLDNIMPLTQKHARAHWVQRRITGHMQASAHLNWQGVGPKPEAKEQLYASTTQGTKGTCTAMSACLVQPTCVAT